MQILTANSLNDGAVVYYQSENTWFRQINSAHIFSSDEDAKQRFLEITESSNINLIGMYLISIEQIASDIRPLSMREKIRAQGPSNLSQSKTSNGFQTTT